ncbi:MAG: ferrochelatase [Myxococcota bacterium]
MTSGSQGRRKRAVILENFGGPRSAEEVEDFLYHLFADPDVIHLPFGGAFQRWVARRISHDRAPTVIPDYEHIGGGSPLVETTYAQAKALERALVERLPDEQRPSIHVGFRYTPPFIDEAVEEALETGAEHLVALPLFPQYSYTTTGSAHNAVAEALVRRGRERIPMAYVPAFYDHPGYVEAVVERVREGLAEAPDPDDVHVLFSAHGIPSRYLREGDPYPRQVQECVRRFVEALGGDRPWTLAWQSRVGPVRWLEPATDVELQRLAAAGTKSVLVVPVSFVGDHIETLYEIGVQYRELAESEGIEWFGVARGIDVHPGFIRCLADQVIDGFAGRFDGICYRCLVPREREHLRRADCLDCKVRHPFYERVWRTAQDLNEGR